MKNHLNKSIIPPGFVAQPSKAAQVLVSNSVMTHGDIISQTHEIDIEEIHVQDQTGLEQRYKRVVALRAKIRAKK